ncbi:MULTISPECIES: dihydrofolate reductase family protein [unclassified Nocardia]|uniref:RibD family protein n=1 Tax=unclassified Nocardia TaxID=2637762 RepID=UPI00278BEE7A|nr:MULTISPECIES: dihydrofolate reductase family protein [unclassified Nocardia]
MTRPYVQLSVAASLDGYIDDTSPDRLMLSNTADFDRVDQLRADSDAILVGAETLRRDNPRLIVKDEQRRAARVAEGKPSTPVKVTVTASGDLDPDLKVWHHGVDRTPIVYSAATGAEKARQRLGDLADVVALGDDIEFADLLDDLGGRGIARLMVEGGGHIHTAFLAAGLVDELLLAVAPILVGDAGAPKFVHPARFPGGPTRRMRLVDTTQLGDVAVLRYRPKEISQ